MTVRKSSMEILIYISKETFLFNAEKASFKFKQNNVEILLLWGNY